MRERFPMMVSRSGSRRGVEGLKRRDAAAAAAIVSVFMCSLLGVDRCVATCT